MNSYHYHITVETVPSVTQAATIQANPSFSFKTMTDDDLFHIVEATRTSQVVEENLQDLKDLINTGYSYYAALSTAGDSWGYKLWREPAILPRSTCYVLRNIITPPDTSSLGPESKPQKEYYRSILRLRGRNIYGYSTNAYRALGRERFL